jgi:hypothetical protein
MKEPSAADRAISARVARTVAERLLSANPNPTWTKAELKAIDQFIAQQNSPEIQTREDAIRRLVELGLKAETR